MRSRILLAAEIIPPSARRQATRAMHRSSAAHIISTVSIAENITGIRQRMAAAAARVKRDPNQITLMAVTKTVEPERIRQAHAAGLRVFGENRVQGFEGKIEALRDLQDAEWHR